MSRKSSFHHVIQHATANLDRFTDTARYLQQKINKKQNIINKSVKNKNKHKKQLKSVKNDLKLSAIRSKINKIDKTNRQRGSLIRNNREKLHKTYQSIELTKHNIRKPYISSMMRKNGFFIRNKIFPLIHIREDTLDDCERLITQKYNKTNAAIANHISIDDNTIKNIKLVFCDEVGDFITSKSVRSLRDVRKTLYNAMNEHNPSNDGTYDRYLMSVDLFIFNPSNRVGCSSRAKDKFIFHLSQNELLRLYSPKTSLNRCFDMCLIKAIQFNSSKTLQFRTALQIRQKLKIKCNTTIDPKGNNAHAIADLLNVSYRAWTGIVKPDRADGAPINQSFKLYAKYGKIDENTIDILLLAGHAYLINDKTIYNIKCTKCGDTRKFGIESNHTCNPTRISYYQKQICNNDNILTIKSLKKDKQRKWVFFDLETLPCGKGAVHNVYAVGWYDYQAQKYHVSYGKQSMITFIKWVLKNPGNTYIAYNGAKFDFYFLQNQLLKEKITTNYLNSGGRLLSLKWGGTTTKNGYTANSSSVWDLYQFMPGFSLKSACKAYKTDFQKLDFDHKKMKNWKSVQKYKNEVLHYLQHDVMSLKELTQTFVNTTEQLFDASPTKYLTLSSYAENVWKSNLTNDEIIETPDLQKQQFISRSIYGGRTYPSQKRYQSKYFKIIQNNKSNSRKLKQIYNLMLKSGHYIFNGDINSQYPSCMAGCDLMPTLYPTGVSKWIKNDPNKCKSIFNDNKQLGIFEIKFKCTNKSIKHPILPRKKIITQKSGKQVFAGVEWSLTDGSGVYNTADIQNAVKHGYQIQFTGTALVYPNVSDNIFKTYVDTVYALKVDATKEENEVKRQICKTLLNSLYGKMLERPISKNEKICKNIDDVEIFASEHVITNWEIVHKNDYRIEYVILVGEKINPTKITKKPRQLGSFVLAYSRRLWMLFLESIDPTLSSNITTYQDTDSLHIMGHHFDLLNDKNMIDDNKLGYLSNDCKNDALIFYEINLAPKCYAYLCLDKNGEIKTVMKSKGIIKDMLQQEWFENETKMEVKWTGLKKIHRNITKKDRANGITHFSIKNQDYSRTFYKNEWKGMTYLNNLFLPFGYQSN